MRLMIAAALLAAGPAFAQGGKVWTPAPVPGNAAAQVAPADRAGSVGGPDASSPFSGLPSGTRTGAGVSTTSRDTSSSADTATPNVSR